MDAGTLMNFGLTKNEAKIYLALLRMGECKVSRLIKESRFKSGKIYQVLDSLAGKGLISHVVKNNVKYYFPHDPKRIRDYINSQKRRLEDEENDFLRCLPDLTKIHSAKKDSCDVKVYDGVEGIRSALFMFVDALKKNSIISLYGANDDPRRDAVLSWPRYRETTENKGIKTRVIMTSVTAKGRELRKGRNFRNYDKEYRYLKGTDQSNFMVCGDLTILFNFEQPNCVLIDNPAYAKQFMDLFSFLWSNSEKL